MTRIEGSKDAYRRRYWYIASLITTLLTASGCAVLEFPDNARSSFALVGSDGLIDKDILNEENRSVSDPDVGRVAYLTGLTYDEDCSICPDGTYYAFAGIAPGYDTGVPVATGVVIYDADYGYLVVDQIYNGWFGINGNDYERRGEIALRADFDSGTLTGEATYLTVDGEIDGGELSGSVVAIFLPGGIDGSKIGTLDGSVGDHGVIGAFHGNGYDTVLAGGLVGTPR